MAKALNIYQIETRLELADSILAARSDEGMTAEQSAAAQILAGAILNGATSAELSAIEGVKSVTHLLVYAQMCMATTDWSERQEVPGLSGDRK